MGILAEVLDIYKTCNVKSFPINCLAILKKLDIKAIPYSSLSPKKQEALKEVSKDSYRLKNIIYYNDDKYQLVEGRMRFNLMHELGHIRLNHMGESWENEQSANCFAAEILAPTVIIHSAKLYKQSDIVNIFNISKEAADIKLQICSNIDTRPGINVAPPGESIEYPYDSISMKIYKHFYNEQMDKLIYSVKMCETCWKDLYNGEKCMECHLKWLKYGSRSMFDEGYLFG